ncbi:transcription initiation factor TFIID subunit 7 isoform X4 [Triticum aestivum]|uniref:transcription initiation factor TFIID subunit 7 isoform X4 n=1 Tax=Triticum aestivum TaxID=4565 RepID=UPI001D032B09|nr:transcription initiation factor TFIID subunit 7-like isoform X4 [Triticum aestivum]
MDEQFILRVPPSVAEQIERLMNESAAGSSSNPDDASLDLSFSEDGRSGTFMIGNQRFPASLLDLPTVVESYKTYDDSFLVKTADIGQAELVHRVEKDLISIMQGVPVNQNASVAGGGEGGDRKKAAPALAPKRNVQEPAANGEEAEADRSDSDESDS